MISSGVVFYSGVVFFGLLSVGIVLGGLAAKNGYWLEVAAGVAGAAIASMAFGALK